MADAVDALIRSLAPGQLQPVYLVHGDLVLAQSAARRLAQALGQLAGTEPQEHRRPPRLAPLLADLRTYSLFASAKVLLVVASAALADRATAATLIDEAQEVLPLGEGDPERELSLRERQAASRLLQVLRLFDLDPQAGSAEALLEQLPEWVLKGGVTGGKKRTPRGKRQIAQLRQDLAALLTASRRAGLAGWAEGDVAELADIVRQGLPPGHCLVLAENAVADDHPVLQLLAERKAALRLSQVTTGQRGGWDGLDALAEELVRETGVAIARDALQELARRTLRKGDSRDKDAPVEADSTARLAGEYRKLAELAQGGRIERRLVLDVVLDRGEEDVWQILDAIGAGRAGEALSRLRRLLQGADDPIATRLSFFALLAGFCRHLTAVRGMMRLARVPAGDTNYPKFKDHHAPLLQAELPTGAANPLAGIHPFRLHKAYLAASRLPEAQLNQLPWQVLQTELQLKGESTDPDGALAALVVRLARG